MLPLYRALRDAGASDVTFLTYQADHGFSGVRPEMADDIREWLGQQLRH